MLVEVWTDILPLANYFCRSAWMDYSGVCIYMHTWHLSCGMQVCLQGNGMSSSLWMNSLLGTNTRQDETCGTDSRCMPVDLAIGTRQQRAYVLPCIYMHGRASCVGMMKICS